LRFIEFTTEEKQLNDFLLLPKLLYTKRTLTQNEEEERKILEGTHVLNKYCTQYKILAYDESDSICGRCVVTVYDDSDTAYVGYFESVEDADCATGLFAKADDCAKRAGCRKIMGPVDTSFWIRYRLKTSAFDRRPYTGEPYNQPYYEKMFTDNGYVVVERWVSNIYKTIPLFYKRQNIYKERLERAVESEYTVVTPKAKEFDRTLDTVYELLSETFKEFVTFKAITKEDFREIFKNYRYIQDCHFVRLILHGEEPVAFSIVLPDYQNMLYGKMTLYKKTRILLKKLRSGNYVSLYMGVKKEHRGLGKALTQKIIRNLYIRRSRCVGALITEGKTTEKYGEERIGQKITYVLFGKEI